MWFVHGMWLLFNCLLLSFALVRSEIFRQILSGNWTVSDDQGRQFTIYTEGGLDSYSALMRAGIIEDPLIGFHDTEYRWIANKSWTFTHTFRANPRLKTGEIIQLVWNELDTFCQISLNNFVLVRVCNSFSLRSLILRNEFGETNDNILKLECKSTNQIAKQIANMMLTVPPPKCWPDTFRGECHVNLVRTTQASFGWDWGPAYPIQGFWNLPEFIQPDGGCWFGTGFKFFTSIKQLSPNDQYNLIYSPELVSWNADISVEILFSPNSLETIREFCISFAMDNLIPDPIRRCFTEYLVTSNLDVPLNLLTDQRGVIPWWPNGMVTGPRTYQLYLNLTTLDGEVLDRISHVVGFRQIELIERPVQSNDSAEGLSFYFQVNGLPTFAKGANWIPSRLLPGRHAGFMKSTDSTGILSIKNLLTSAAAAGVNMIRVWGGGRYEPDWFYEQADRLGLMIWQDMMFAVSTYTAGDYGMESDSVKEEIRGQIRRLHSHPSIVVWATDNEVKQAVDEGWYTNPRNETLLNLFQTRFVKSVASVINEEERPNSTLLTGDGASLYRPRRCLISSPSNGIVTERLEGMDWFSQDTRFGDVHYYAYSGNLWSESRYPITRFTSEFGLQSLPTPLAWQRSLTNGPSIEKQWDINGPLMSHRNHHSLGETLFRLATEHLGQPVDVSDPIRQYSKWAYLTQVNQLMAYRTHINMLMRHQCRIVNSDGKKQTAQERSSMGAMYWQLNDIWAAPTWSTIDAAGQWKMAHYGAVRECFSDLSHTGRLSAQIVSDVVEVDWIPPDQPEKTILRPEQVRIRCLTIDWFKPKTEWLQTIHWPKHNNTCPLTIIKTSTSALIDRCLMTYLPRPHIIIQLDMIIQKQVTPKGGTVLQFDLPAEISRWPIYSGYRGIKIRQVKPLLSSTRSTRWPMPWKPSHVFQLRVTSRSPELFVWLELDPGFDVQYWFDENAFHLLDGNGIVVRLYLSTDRPVRVGEIRAALRFHSLSTMRQM